MGKRNTANKGKGKVIVAAFGAVVCNGVTYSAVLMATQRKGKGAMFTQLWAIVPGQGSTKAPAPKYVLSVAIAPLGLAQGHACNQAQAQALFNAHPRRVGTGPGSPAAQFGLTPKPMPAPKAAPAASAAPASPAK